MDDLDIALLVYSYLADEESSEDEKKKSFGRQWNV